MLPTTQQQAFVPHRHKHVIFGNDGRDGVVTDDNGLIYMRARYYSPEMRRFVNADIISGDISNAVTLNRYAYANGNPVSNVDPFGLSAERWGDHITDTDVLGLLIDGAGVGFLAEKFMEMTVNRDLFGESLVEHTKDLVAGVADSFVDVGNQITQAVTGFFSRIFG